MNNDRPGQDIEQQRWQSVIEAALDPAERARVQSFLAAAPLSQETPAWLDQSLLAPRRAAGATSDECATVFANLGYAALNSPPNWGTVEFAMGCAEQIGLLAAADGDLALRRRFLAAKGTLFAAALSAQPHLVWNMAAGRCAEYCNALREQAPDQPPDIVLAHATAAFALTNQLLDHLQAIRAVRHYARDIEALVDAALAYYADYTDEIDDLNAERRSMADEAEASWRRQRELLEK